MLRPELHDLDYIDPDEWLVSRSPPMGQGPANDGLWGGDGER